MSFTSGLVVVIKWNEKYHMVRTVTKSNRKIDKKKIIIINVRETEGTIQRNWQHLVHKTQDDDKQNKITEHVVCVWHLYAQTNQITLRYFLKCPFS